MAHTHKTSCIVLVVDRLGAGFLGPYGNTWVETPVLNWLASRGQVFERCVADSVELNSAYDALWSGRQWAIKSSAPPLLMDFMRPFACSCLVTDEPDLIAHPMAESFQELIHFPLERPTSGASHLDDTQTAKLLYVASEWIQSQQDNGPFCLWVHASAMSHYWDAPAETRNQFADEDDPVPPNFTDAPQTTLAANTDPDVLLGFGHAYAGEVSALDHALGNFLSDLDQLIHLDETVVALASPRGYPLGEHGRVGGGSVHSEGTQVPLILMPTKQDCTNRIHSFRQPCDLIEELAAELQIESSQASDPIPDRALSLGENSSAFHTPVWSLVESDGATRLYAKPDDRWDFNDVAEVCPDIVEKLLSLRENFIAVRQNPRLELLPLPIELLERWE